MIGVEVSIIMLSVIFGEELLNDKGNVRNIKIL